MSKHLNQTNVFWLAKKYSYKNYIKLVFNKTKDYLQIQAFNKDLPCISLAGLLLNIALNDIQPSAVIKYPNRYTGNYPLKDVVPATYRTSPMNSSKYAGIGLKSGVFLESMYVNAPMQTPPHLYPPPTDPQKAWDNAITGAVSALYKVGVKSWEAVYLRAYLDYMHRWGSTPPAEVAPHPVDRGVVIPEENECKEIFFAK